MTGPGVACRCPGIRTGNDGKGAAFAPFFMRSVAGYGEISDKDGGAGGIRTLEGQDPNTLSRRAP